MSAHLLFNFVLAIDNPNIARKITSSPKLADPIVCDFFAMIENRP